MREEIDRVCVCVGGGEGEEESEMIKIVTAAHKESFYER